MLLHLSVTFLLQFCVISASFLTVLFRTFSDISVIFSLLMYFSVSPVLTFLFRLLSIPFISLDSHLVGSLPLTNLTHLVGLLFLLGLTLIFRDMWDC